MNSEQFRNLKRGDIVHVTIKQNKFIGVFSAFRTSSGHRYDDYALVAFGRRVLTIHQKNIDDSPRLNHEQIEAIQKDFNKFHKHL